MHALTGAMAFTIMASAVSAAPPGTIETELQARTQALVDAVAPGNKAPWNEALDQNFIGMDENGSVKTKDELLREIEPLPPGLVGHIKVENFRVRQTGQLAIAVYELQESLDYRGQPLHTRYRSVDTWLRTKQGWKLMAQH
ncbi:MAG TPA: nuclear transport factor 2 family protein, partial [Sphingomicrobium sp.]